MEGLAEAQPALGRVRSVARRLRPHVDRYPMRGRLVGQYARALHRSGRRVEARETVRHLRSWLVTELSVEPGDASRELMLSFLHDGPDPHPAGPHPLSLHEVG